MLVIDGRAVVEGEVFGVDDVRKLRGLSAVTERLRKRRLEGPRRTDEPRDGANRSSPDVGDDSHVRDSSREEGEGIKDN